MTSRPIWQSAARIVVAVLLIAMLGTLAGASRQDVDEQKVAKVKSAFLFKFTGFIRWPDNRFADEAAPIVIGILGADPFGTTLDDTVAGRTVANRPVVIRRITTNRSDDAVLKDIAACHILYIGKSEAARLKTWLDATKGTDTLTVSSLERFARRGGMVGFILEDRRILFEMNLDLVKGTRLKVSGKLLKVARLIEGAGS